MAAGRLIIVILVLYFEYTVIHCKEYTLWITNDMVFPKRGQDILLQEHIGSAARQISDLTRLGQSIVPPVQDKIVLHRDSEC